MPTIYAIVDPQQRVYIGCTKSSYMKRLREHRCLLRAGKHTCRPLQAAWDEVQGAGFWARTIDECDEQNRRERELYWMRQYQGTGQLLNEHLISFRPTDAAIAKGVAHAHDKPGNRWTPEANLTRRLAQLGKPKGHGAKISATKRAKAMR